MLICSVDRMLHKENKQQSCGFIAQVVRDDDRNTVWRFFVAVEFEFSSNYCDEHPDTTADSDYFQWFEEPCLICILCDSRWDIDAASWQFCFLVSFDTKNAMGFCVNYMY